MAMLTLPQSSVSRDLQKCWFDAQEAFLISIIVNISVEPWYIIFQDYCHFWSIYCILAEYKNSYF